MFSVFPSDVPVPVSQPAGATPPHPTQSSNALVNLQGLHVNAAPTSTASMGGQPAISAGMVFSPSYTEAFPWACIPAPVLPPGPALRGGEVSEYLSEVSSGLIDTFQSMDLSKRNPKLAKGRQIYCHMCDVHVCGESNFKAHISGTKHIKMLNPSLKIRCDLCNVECNGQSVYEAHLSGKRHQKVVIALSMQNGLPCPPPPSSMCQPCFMPPPNGGPPGVPVLKPTPVSNAVQQLYEFAAKYKLSVEFREGMQDGPAHKPSFTMRVLVAGNELGVGTSGTKKAAKNEAAMQAMIQLKEDESLNRSTRKKIVRPALPAPALSLPLTGAPPPLMPLVHPLYMEDYMDQGFASAPPHMNRRVGRAEADFPLPSHMINDLQLGGVEDAVTPNAWNSFKSAP